MFDVLLFGQAGTVGVEELVDLGVGARGPTDAPDDGPDGDEQEPGGEGCGEKDARDNEEGGQAGDH